MYLKNKLFPLLLVCLILGGCSTFKNGFLGLAPMGDRKEYTRARDLYNHQQYEQAVKELTGYIYKAGNVKRREARAYRLLGRSYEQLGLLNKALETYLEALEFHPRNVPLLLCAADLYQRTGLFEKSQSLYERALQEEPNNVEALLGLAENYRLFGFYSKARTYYEQFFALTPTVVAQQRAHYASVLLNQRDFQSAFIHITQALAQDATQPDYWLISAKAACGIGNFTQALTDIDTAIALATQRTDLQLYRIIILYQTGNYAVSLQRARSLLKAYPQEPLGLLLAALNEWKLGYKQRARQHAKQAAAMDEKTFVGRVAAGLVQEWK